MSLILTELTKIRMTDSLVGQIYQLLGRQLLCSTTKFDTAIEAIVSAVLVLILIAFWIIKAYRAYYTGEVAVGSNAPRDLQGERTTFSTTRKIVIDKQKSKG